MNWAEFLTKIEEHVALVGPLLSTPPALSVPTIYIDGGANFVLRRGAAPFVSVGDGDSALHALDKSLPAKKDFSDLAFALHALPASIRLIELFGFLGGRRDHELANFGEAHFFLSRRPQPTRMNFYGESQIEVMGFSPGDWSLELHGPFSFFLFESAAVQICGQCEYTVTEPLLLPTLSSRGLSNIGHGEVRFSSHGPFFIMKS